MTHYLKTFASGRSAGVIIGMALMFGAGGASAQSSIDVNAARAGQAETRTRVVPVAMGDAATPEGQRRLDNRLRVAAGEVCGKFSTDAIRVPADYTQCVDRALSGARAQIGTQTAMSEGSVRVSTN